MDRATARSILGACNANHDFHAMPSSDVERLLHFADDHKYRKPKNANGSRGRYFHAFLMRVARHDPQSTARAAQTAPGRRETGS